MRKLLIALFGMMVFLGPLSLYAGENQTSGTYVSNFKSSMPLLENQSVENQEIRKGLFGPEMNFFGGGSYSTHVVLYQYTPDGWMQHIGVYPDCIIITNVTGPIEGTQFIKTSEGTIFDMSHSYTKQANHFTNKYLWGEINSYENYQLITVR